VDEDGDTWVGLKRMGGGRDVLLGVEICERGWRYMGEGEDTWVGVETCCWG
jgi:hypothetical protein